MGGQSRAEPDTTQPDTTRHDMTSVQVCKPLHLECREPVLQLRSQHGSFSCAHTLQKEWQAGVIAVVLSSLPSLLNCKISWLNEYSAELLPSDVTFCEPPKTLFRGQILRQNRLESRRSLYILHFKLHFLWLFHLHCQGTNDKFSLTSWR